VSTAELVHRIRPAAGEPEGALVLLHGRGTSADDLFPLLDALDPERRRLGVTARAVEYTLFQCHRKFQRGPLYGKGVSGACG
jgi:predicted esterase